MPDKPSVNILLTRFCNNSCAYCFASSYHKTSKHSESLHMSLENINSVISFLRHQDIKDIRLLGGEPLLHPQIEAVFSKIKSINEFDHISIFTGGLFPVDVVPLLRDDRISVIININHPKDYTNNKYQQLRTNLNLMANNGIRMTAGFNIYEEDFEYKPILDICEEFSIHSLRLCFANPTSTNDKLVLSRIEKKKISPKVYSVAMECAKRGMQIFFDCCINPCTFSDQEWGSMLKLFPNLTARPGVCNPSLDIDPDLRVYRCFGFGFETFVDLRNFKDTNDLFDFFLLNVDSYKWINSPEECGECIYYARRVCQGDCLGFSTNRLTSLRKKHEDARLLAFQAQNNLREGSFGKAKEQFEKSINIYDRDADIICDYVFSLLKTGENDSAKAAWYRYNPYFKNEDIGCVHLIDGFIYESDRKYELALQSFRKALLHANGVGRNEILRRIKNVESLSKHIGEVHA